MPNATVTPANRAQYPRGCPFSSTKAWPGLEQRLPHLKLLRALAICLCAALLGAYSPRPALAADPAAALPPLPSAHEVRQIEGWTVRVDERLLHGEGQEVGDRAMRLLTARLVSLEVVLAGEALARLRQVPIQLDLTHGSLHNMQYHPSAGWLTNHGYSASLEKCVHIPDAQYFLSPFENHRQPSAVLHELAHAYHDQVLGFDQPRIRAAWQAFRDNGRYRSVLTSPGGRREHYALTDPKEFFAEMTECYLGVNDFFPFVAGELKQEEPAIFQLMSEIWGPLPGRRAAPKPNILLILADDMRADSIGALGNPHVKTPHLDRLVSRGLAFRNAYCLGGNSAAVCTPSRNMLLSGQSFFRWGGQAVAPGGPPNLPLSMKEAGYLTYHHGKKGNTAPAIQAHFEINKSLENDDADRRNGEPGKRIVDDAIAFLRQRSEQTNARPFFMYLAPANPHDPRVAAASYLERYQPDQIPLPRNYLPQHPFDNGEMTVRDETLSPWPRTEAEIRRTLHHYYATITGLDFHLGRLFATLDELHLTSQTLIIFASDQGISVGSHGLLGKQNLYDHTMKVPLILAGPDIPAGQRDALVYLLDLYPTLCELVKLPVPSRLDGKSFLPVITGGSTEARSRLHLAYRDVQRGWRDRRWKLLRYPQVNVTQLFDLQSDPDELVNLAERPEQTRRVREKWESLEAAQRSFGDTLPLTVAQPHPAAWKPPEPTTSPAGQERR